MSPDQKKAICLVARDHPRVVNGNERGVARRGRSDARPQSRLFARENPRLRPNSFPFALKRKSKPCAKLFLLLRAFFLRRRKRGWLRQVLRDGNFGLTTGHFVSLIFISFVVPAKL